MTKRKPPVIPDPKPHGRKDGIRTIEALKDRCIVDPESGCWRWAGATRGGEAVVWIPTLGTKSMSGALLALMGEKKAGNVRLIPRCGDLFCGNPQHRWRGTVKDLMAMRPRPALTTVAKLRRAQRKRAKFCSPELKAEIMASNETSTALAKRIGCHLSLVSKVRRGVAWQDVGASIFTTLALNPDGRRG